VTTDFRPPSPNFCSQGSSFLITLSNFFWLTYINLPPLADGSILHPWNPLVLIHTLFLAQNYYSASMQTRILETRSQAFYLYSSYLKHVHHVQSVSFFLFFFLASSHRAPFSVLTAIRQSKPYTVTFFTVQYGVSQFSFTASIILFHFFSIFIFPGSRKAEWG
jgi:hypothetical protein